MTKEKVKEPSETKSSEETSKSKIEMAEIPKSELDLFNSWKASQTSETKSTEKPDPVKEEEIKTDESIPQWAIDLSKKVDSLEASKSKAKDLDNKPDELKRIAPKIKDLTAERNEARKRLRVPK